MTHLDLSSTLTGVGGTGPKCQLTEGHPTRVVIDTFQKYRRYSISILALKVSSISISISSRKSIDIDIDTSISILSLPIFAKINCLCAWTTATTWSRAVTLSYSAISTTIAFTFFTIV